MAEEIPTCTVQNLFINRVSFSGKRNLYKQYAGLVFVTFEIKEYTWEHSMNINFDVFYSTFTNAFLFLSFFAF